MKEDLRGLDVDGDNTNVTIRKTVRGLEMYGAGFCCEHCIRELDSTGVWELLDKLSNSEVLKMKSASLIRHLFDV
jgi:hypothetical protein